jgi:hypothetical protein
MPTKRRRRERFRRPDIDGYHWALLTDAEIPEPLPDDWNPFAFHTFHKVERELWALFRERILSDWLDARPGTRPRSWWRCEAPRDEKLGQGWYYHADMIQGRLLLKGSGRPAWCKYNLVPSWHYGIPAHWTGGDPGALVFESQFDYLRRHELLVKGERRSSSEPEFVPALWDF